MRRVKAGLVLASAMAVMATSASAAVVCNEDGDCWRVKERYRYKPEFRLRVYEDDWKWADSDRGKYRWKEGRGRGYYRSGVWIDF
jgi:hypothetical protein